MLIMFSDNDRNMQMIQGAYLRIKTYYHYNKNFIFMKKKLAIFEEDEAKMCEVFQTLSNVLMSPDKNCKVVKKWIDSIDYYVLPKSFKTSNNQSGIFVSGAAHVDEAVNKVNFFIDMPIELHILDSLWCLLLGKIVHDNNVLSSGCFGNCLDDYVIYNKSNDYFESINFKKSKLFKVYFNQYCSWKNNAIDAVKKNYRKNNLAMATLDVKGFYYSVIWEFKNLSSFVHDDERLDDIAALTKIMAMVFESYTERVAQVRELKQNISKKQCILPIGLFSSMLLANLYLSEYDKHVKSMKNIIYYGRYVDDIIIVFNLESKNLVGEDREFDELLVEEYPLLQREGEIYSIRNEPNLMIQREKVKIIFFEKRKSYSLVKSLEGTRNIPSQMNVIPETDLNLEDFEEAAYVVKNLSRESKIREISQQEVDRFKLGWHMSQIVISNKRNMNQMTKEEREQTSKEKDKVIDFFQGSNALNYCSNWLNAFYFFLLVERSGLRYWNTLKGNIKAAIKNLRIDHLDAVYTSKNKMVKNRMKSDMFEMLNICMSTALSLNPGHSRKESTEVLELAIMLRHANLFNHNLVNIPLINYSDNLPDDVDLTRVSVDQCQSYKRIYDSKKCRYSPRFINIDELFHHLFLVYLPNPNNFLGDVDDEKLQRKIANVFDYFYSVNHIMQPSESNFDFSVSNELVNDNYILQKVNLGKRKCKQIKVAIANVNLDLRRCCIGLPFNQEEIKLNKSDFLNWLKRSNEENVDYLLLPEFYLPIEWIGDVLSFVKRSGISVISGLQYISTLGDDGKIYAHNNIAVFPAIYSGSFKQFRSSCILVREKNDYAPVEKELLALYKVNCRDSVKPIYQVIEQNGIRFGTFLCYEFTDILARALYKNRVDVLFTPEHNKDTNYFSNIIESTTRDLHSFIVQSNTSIYGDSRITGPFDRDNKNIVQIKGGDTDSIIIGTIDIPAVRHYQASEKGKQEEKIKGLLELKKDGERRAKLKEYEDPGPKICKTSARFICK